MDARLRDPDASEMEGVRVGIVLSAGGLRGAAHVGVLRQLVRHGVPLHAIVGVSAGAIVVIPDRLRQLEGAGFNRLHHGVDRLGIVCHDPSTGRPHYFGTGFDEGVTLHEVVRASASIPFLFPAISVSPGGEALRLTDGGLSDPVPLTFARRPALGATHIIVSDCRLLGRVRAPADPCMVCIRPSIRVTGSLWSPREGLLATVRDGEAAVTGNVLRVVTGWLGGGSRRLSQRVSQV
jgi:predicted acylesterase/phospholipase RssA